MRTFWRLSRDANAAKLASINGYDFGGIHPYIFSRGIAFAHTSVPDSVKLYVRWDKYKRPDYMAGPISWPIASKRFVEVISRAASDFQALDVKLFTMKGNVKTEDLDCGYVVLNVTRVVPSINLDKSSVIRSPSGVTVMPDGIVIDGDRVPDSAHLFRAQEHLGTLLVSNELANDMKGKGLKGVVLYPCTTI